MNAKSLAGIALAILFFLALLAAIVPTAIPWPAAAPAASDVGRRMWGDRAVEVLVQGVILVGGVVAILLLLEAAKRREAVP